jgi:two-component system, cell cycle sensor histidine kinase and response regulator CckA
MPEQRIEALHAIRGTEADWREMMEENLAAIFIASPQGRVHACNSAFARLFGFTSPADAIGVGLDTLYPAEVLAQRLARVRAEGRVPQATAEMRHVDGQPLFVIDRLVGRFDDRGNLVAVTGFLIDDTAREALQQQLRHAMKMAAVGRLASGIAHDFNNLLMIIIGLSEALLEQIAPDDPIRPELDQILEAGRRGSTLAAQILALSRKRVPRPSVFDVDAALAALKPMMARLAGGDIALSVVASPEPKWVHADREQLEQVLLNLATNAHDAMPGGGTLTIDTTIAPPSSASGAASNGHLSRVLIRMTDTGIGMSAETQARIFEPYFTTKAHGKGTGLGLVQVHTIVTENGGTIDVRSVLGVGTTFTIGLPLASPPDLVDTDAWRARTIDDAETVLVVDDELSVRALVCNALERLGYRVLLAEHADAALVVVQERGPALGLLVTDVVMPGRSGRELAIDVRARLPGLPVLFISGYPEHVLDLDSAGLPAASFLQKPFTLDALARRVREMLDGATGARHVVS